MLARFVTPENKKWWTLAAVSVGLFMIMLDNTVVNVALPSIQRSLHASTSSLEWTVNAYTLSFAVLLVTGGRLGDLFGRRVVFLTGVVIFVCSSGAIGFSPSDTWLEYQGIVGHNARFRWSVPYEVRNLADWSTVRYAFRFSSDGSTWTRLSASSRPSA